MKNQILHILNVWLRPFNIKVIKTSESFDWMGKEYHLPFSTRVSYANSKVIVKDYFNNELPLVFNNEEEARFFINVIDVSINPYKGY
jgi:hypothetical protein